MDHIQVFDGLDEMFASIERGVQQANAAATPRQNRITYGDYWLRFWEDIVIFGHIQTLEDFEKTERELGADDDEIAYERDVMASSYARGFRFGRAYSVIVPEGELGDTHVASMIPITKEEFEEAQSLNWSPDEILNCRWIWGIVERLAEEV